MPLLLGGGHTQGILILSSLDESWDLSQGRSATCDSDLAADCASQPVARKTQGVDLIPDSYVNDFATTWDPVKIPQTSPFTPTKERNSETETVGEGSGVSSRGMWVRSQSM